MTNQEAFNRVWQHFVVEKQPRSYVNNDGCCYRGPNGAKCAVGVLIPDELYRPEMEDWSVTSLNSRADEFPTLFGPGGCLAGANIDLLTRIQAAHDSYSIYGNPEFDRYMGKRLREIAQQFSLTIPEPGGSIA